MKNKRESFIAIVVTSCLAWSSLASSALAAPASTKPVKIVVVVNIKNPISKVPIDGLRDIFLKRKTRWPGGKPIMLFNQPAKSKLRVAFDRIVLRMSPEEVASYWIKRRIQGKGQPPPSIRSTRTVLRIVAQQREAIAYLPADRLGGLPSSRKVKVIIVDDHKIDDPKYPLTYDR